MPYYNKLMGLCAAELVVNKKLELIDRNVEKFRVLKESSIQQVLERSKVTEGKYKFSFEIVPCLPLHFEKMASENSKMTTEKKKRW